MYLEMLASAKMVSVLMGVQLRSGMHRSTVGCLLLPPMDRAAPMTCLEWDHLHSACLHTL